MPEIKSVAIAGVREFRTAGYAIADMLTRLRATWNVTCSEDS